MGIGFQLLSNGSPKYLLIWAWVGPKVALIGLGLYPTLLSNLVELIFKCEKKNSRKFHGNFVELYNFLKMHVDDFFKNSNWSDENVKSGPCCICELWLTLLGRRKQFL